MKPLDAFKLHQSAQETVPSVIFFVSRDCDAKFQIYRANRRQDALIPQKEVSCATITCPQWQNETPLSAVLLNNFYGLHVEPIVGSKKYAAFLNAFPDREMILTLRKNPNPMQVDGGRVASYVTLNFANEGQKLPNVEMFNIHLHMTFNDLGVPDVSQVFINGIVARDQVPPTLHRYCEVLPGSDRLLITETIQVTEEMKSKFDAFSLAQQWMNGQKKTN